jgi:hypothetical protein
MTLENLLRIGKLKAHAAGKVEIDRILAAADRALADATECAAEARSVLAAVRGWIAAHRADLV